MNTIISNNIKRISERIDTSGNVIDPRTKQIIKPNVIEVVSQQDMIPKQQETTQRETPIETPVESKVGSKIEEMINRKIEALVAKKIEEALSKL